MEELLSKLRACSRLLELEDCIPDWEGQIPVLKARMEEMTAGMEQKEQALLSLQSHTFFQSILTMSNKKAEKLRRQLQEMTAARTAAQWELSSLEKKLASGIREREALQNSKQAYEQAKAGDPLTPAQESRLLMEEIAAFVPAARKTAGSILEALEDVRFWMQQDGIGKLAVQNSMEKAETEAMRLQRILQMLPEGVATVGSYLRAPQAFFAGEVNRMDRLNQAQEQIQTIANQLRLLLGE